jgi:hypothetical protein
MDKHINECIKKSKDKVLNNIVYVVLTGHPNKYIGLYASIDEANECILSNLNLKLNSKNISKHMKDYLIRPIYIDVTKPIYIVRDGHFNYYYATNDIDEWKSERWYNITNGWENNKRCLESCTIHLIGG